MQRLLLKIVCVIYLLRIHQDITLCAYRILLNEKPCEQMDALIFYNLIHGSLVNTNTANDFGLQGQNQKILFIGVYLYPGTCSVVFLLPPSYPPSLPSQLLLKTAQHQITPLVLSQGWSSHFQLVIQHMRRKLHRGRVNKKITWSLF